MVSMFTILTNLLLASVAFAAPSQLQARIDRRRENRQSNPVNRLNSTASAVTNVQYDSNWAGAVFNEGPGTFTTVTGTFTVPTPSGNDGAASAWVGIDGDTCTNAILQTGVDFVISGGSVSYDAWYEWYPAAAIDFSGITINSGDVISATVVASSTTSGTAIIQNLSTGVTVTQDLTSGSALCEQDAEWIVEDFDVNGTPVPFADFDIVTFDGASASDSNGNVYNPSSANTLDIEQNGQVLTSTSTGDFSVTIQYV